jgi:hypothetical protein
MNLRQYIGYMRRYPPQLLLRKAANEIRFVYREIASQRPPQNPAQKLTAAVRVGVFWEEVPSQWRTVLRDLFLLSSRDKRRILAMLHGCCPQAEPLILREADQICNHQFDLLGSGPTFLGDRIDWHYDFISNYRWPTRRYFRRIRPAPYPGGYDVKVPWELSRCYHFARLGQAYWITTDERYAREFVSQWTSWVEDNPCPLGVNWVCPMEVAIRAVNWIWGLAFFLDSPHITDDFLIRMSAGLYEHGQHILNNLEGQPGQARNGNHYLSDLVGLIYVGICCPFFNASPEWLRFAVDELWSEVLHQFLPDGVNFESSTSYHRLVCELVLSAVALCRKNGMTPPDEVLHRIDRANDFVGAVQMPNGLTPVIGDADNGRLHRLAVWNVAEHEWQDYRYLLPIAHGILGSQCMDVPSEHWQEAIWMLGRQPKVSFEDSDQYHTIDVASRSFVDSGMYVMGHGDLYLLVHTGQRLAPSKTSHVHNDLGSIVMHAYGTTFIVDPGSYVYTRDYRQRHLFRSTMWHNTVAVDAADQHVVADDEFAVSSVTTSTVNLWQCTAEMDLLDMTHHGYERLPDAVTHRRKILFDKRHGFWIVGDFLTCQGHHHSTVSYHFNTLSVQPDLSKPRPTYIVSGGDLSPCLVVQLFSQPASQRRIESGWIAPGYGSRREAPVLRVEAQHTGDVRVITVLVPARSGDRLNDYLLSIEPVARDHMDTHFDFPPSLGATH